MKRFSIASLGAIALLGIVPFTGAIPGVPSIWNMGSASAQNIQPKSQLHLQLDAAKLVVQTDGQNKQKITWQPLQDKNVVQPKDVLRYTISGENNSDRPLKNLKINQPIPQGMVYVLKSATLNVNDGTKISYSIDGARSFVENPTVKVTLPNGKVETQPAPATAYTHIRWNVPSIAAKTIVKGTYQVQVR